MDVWLVLSPEAGLEGFSILGQAPETTPWLGGRWIRRPPVGAGLWWSSWGYKKATRQLMLRIAGCPAQKGQCGGRCHAWCHQTVRERSIWVCLWQRHRWSESDQEA